MSLLFFLCVSFYGCNLPIVALSATECLGGGSRQLEMLPIVLLFYQILSYAISYYILYALFAYCLPYAFPVALLFAAFIRQVGLWSGLGPRLEQDC